MVTPGAHEPPAQNPDPTSSPELPDPSSLLRCPRCQSGLAYEAASQQSPADAAEPAARAALLNVERVSCQRCGKSYPVLLGVPVVSARPEEWRERWEKGLGLFSDWMMRAEKELQVAFFDEELSERSQNRIGQVVRALGQHREEVLALMGRAGIHPKAQSDSQQSGAPKSSPSEWSPETYFSHMLRDYAWQPEVDEVAASWARLKAVLPPDFTPGNTLVLGAGTGRLAWQFASEFDSSASVLALDVNPLPFLVTQLLMAGEEVKLTELPAHPRRSSHVAVTRRLSCALPATSRVKLALADALDPPVALGRWDTVVAPWFVDEVPTDAAVVPELARGLLREGGSFICVGPLLYDNAHTKAFLRYCGDEFVDLVRRAGFEVTRATYDAESYMASPLSSHSRVEHVLYLHARKDSSRRSVPPEVPAYLKPGPGAALPIPPPPGVREMQFSPEQVAQVAALVDGSRNVRQITKMLLDRGVLVNDGTAESAVRGCLKIMLKQLRERRAQAPSP